MVRKAKCLQKVIRVMILICLNNFWKAYKTNNWWTGNMMQNHLLYSEIASQLNRCNFVALNMFFSIFSYSLFSPVFFLSYSFSLFFCSLYSLRPDYPILREKEPKKELAWAKLGSAPQLHGRREKRKSGWQFSPTSQQLVVQSSQNNKM